MSGPMDITVAVAKSMYVFNVAFYIAFYFGLLYYLCFFSSYLDLKFSWLSSAVQYCGMRYKKLCCIAKNFTTLPVS